MTADLRAIAREMLSPARRPARNSSVLWAIREDVATRVGPVVTWTSGAGPVVVLVHGWDADHYDMDAFVQPLVDAGRRVVTFDLPAHGESPGDIASLFDLGIALEDVAKHFGSVDAIVAHSAGCAATALALEAGLPVRIAAFVAPPLRYVDFVRFISADRGVDPEAMIATFNDLGYDVGSLDIRKNAAGISGVPLLIVHSNDDRVCDAGNATKIAAVWPGATAEHIDGLGHTRILRDPDIVRRVVEHVATDSAP